MKIPEVKDVILEALCEVYHVQGANAYPDADAFQKHFSPKGISRGQIDVALRQLSDEKLIQTLQALHGMSIKYAAHEATYLEWLEAQESQAEEEAKDTRWQPLQVEKFEELATKIDAVADALHGENGYRDNHPLEADLTIEVSRNLSASLKENDGTILWERLKYFETLMERVLTIFDKTTRIGKIVGPIILFILALLGLPPLA